jgi:hypothetical protein
MMSDLDICPEPRDFSCSLCSGHMSLVSCVIVHPRRSVRRSLLDRSIRSFDMLRTLESLRSFVCSSFPRLSDCTPGSRLPANSSIHRRILRSLLSMHTRFPFSPTHISFAFLFFCQWRHPAVRILMKHSQSRYAWPCGGGEVFSRDRVPKGASPTVPPMAWVVSVTRIFLT